MQHIHPKVTMTAQFLAIKFHDRHNIMMQ